MPAGETPYPNTDYMDVRIVLDPFWLAKTYSAHTYQSLWENRFGDDFGVSGFSRFPNSMNTYNSSDNAIPVEFIATYCNITEEGFEEQQGVAYSPTDVAGREEAYQTYQSGENRQVSLTFKFQALAKDPLGPRDEEAASLGEDVQSPFQVMFWARWLGLLKERVYYQTEGTYFTFGPPPVLLKIGSLLVMRAVCTGADITWQPPFELPYMLPHGADVACTFVSVMAPPPYGTPEDPDTYVPEYRLHPTVANLLQGVPRYNQRVQFFGGFGWRSA